MTRERVKSAERTSFGTPGTTETLGALHSPPVASGGLCRLLSSTPFQSSYGECRLTREAHGNSMDLWRHFALTLLVSIEESYL
jgi:hypothetical protein